MCVFDIVGDWLFVWVLVEECWICIVFDMCVMIVCVELIVGCDNGFFVGVFLWNGGECCWGDYVCVVCCGGV